MKKYDEFKKLWKDIVRPLAMEVMEKATSDKADIHQSLGNMIWITDYDLLHNDVDRSLYDIDMVKLVLTDEEYYKERHSGSPQEEISRMKKLANLLNDLQKLIYLEE